MRKSYLLGAVFSLIIIFFILPTAAHADGIIIPEPPICLPEDCPPPPCLELYPCPPTPPTMQLAIRYHRVTVSIRDQVAITRVDQVFYNPNQFPVEGIYLFPLPKDASVSSFTLWIDGEPVKGEVLNADQARQKYEQIVRDLRDPALLEYVDRGAIQARIFPIPAGGERKIELEYNQALLSEEGLVSYVYPLNTEKFSLYPLEEVSIHVDIQSHIPIRAVYSPSHEVAISREGDQHVKVGYEDEDVSPDKDFTLFYSLGEEEAFHLMTFRDPQDPSGEDGFFLLLLAPKPESGEQVAIPKDVLLVLDRSGSMDGEKFIQAQTALSYILDHLNPEDRFNIIAFSTGMEYYAQKLRPTGEAEEARVWVNRLSAQGSTDINRALLEAVAMADSERPTYLIFLTDGLPTEGVTDSQEILANLRETARQNTRLFVFGVGYDVDTFLLDSLAQEHHGTSIYVLPERPLDEMVSAFYTKISTPVLTDLKLDFGEAAAYDIYPSPLPDLFLGSQIVAVGRYRNPATTTVTLTGKVGGEYRSFKFTNQVFTFTLNSESSDSLSAIPRIWATRKVGYLLNQLRLKGTDQESIDQIVKLSIRYGIVTPYTSYLVTEPSPLGAAEQERIAEEQFQQYQTMPEMPAYGQAAVEKAAGQGGMADANAPIEPILEAKKRIRVIGARTFIFQDGVWIDTGYDPDTMKTVKVAFLSKDYFELADAKPDLGAAFALSERVIVISEGVVYEVIEGASATQSSNESPIATSQPAASEVGYEPADDTSDNNSKPEISTNPLSCLSGLLAMILLALVGIKKYLFFA